MAPKTRISALDYAKGALVLIMVLYHWLNYFVIVPDFIYRYLRFLTPSFIFLTGFLIAQVTLSRPGANGAAAARRFALRGLKILALFVVLNLLKGMVVGPAFGVTSIESFIGTFLTGNSVGGGESKTASFFVLLPISYVLFIAALLTIAVGYVRHAVHIAAALSVMAVLLLGFGGFHSGNFELISMGLLGASAGYLPMERIASFAHRALLVIPAYVAYLIAISIWGEIYLMQVAGVCLTLALIYLVHGDRPDTNPVRRAVILLGKYSLLGYIGQIAVLQVLARGFRLVDLGRVTPALALLLAVALTMVLVWVTDRARARATAVDRLYVAVFA